MYEPEPAHRFTFGLWTVGNPGGDAFGQPGRPRLSPADLVYLLGGVGAYGVNFHDNDLIPIEATLKAFKKALTDPDVVVPMATTNLFDEPVLMDEFKGPYSAGKAEALKAAAFDRAGLGERGLAYERLNQLTVELLLGAR